MVVRRATIKDVAARAGVSPATVSNVLLGRKAASLDVADRVRAIAGELGYSPDRAASQLRSGKTRIVTALVPNLTDPFFAAVIDAFERQAQADGFDLIVASSNATEEGERKRLSALLSWRPAGVVVIPQSDAFPSRQEIDALRLPYVVVDRASSKLPVDAVVSGNREATAEAVGYLLDQGHDSMLVVASTFRLENIRERYQGVIDQFATRGLPPPPSLEVGLTFEMVAERLAVWLADNKRPTAILTVTNFVTMGVMAHFAQIGTRVPRDVSLIGFDDYPWMRAASPAITAIRQDVAALAEQAWTMLRARMADAAAPVRRVTVPCRLVMRDSVRRAGRPVEPVAALQPWPAPMRPLTSPD